MFCWVEELFVYGFSRSRVVETWRMRKSRMFLLCLLLAYLASRFGCNFSRFGCDFEKLRSFSFHIPNVIPLFWTCFQTYYMMIYFAGYNFEGCAWEGEDACDLFLLSYMYVELINAWDISQTLEKEIWYLFIYFEMLRM